MDKQSLLRCTAVCKSFSKITSADSLWRVHLNDWLTANTIATPVKVMESAQSIKRLVKYVHFGTKKNYQIWNYF